MDKLIEAQVTVHQWVKHWITEKQTCGICGTEKGKECTQRALDDHRLYAGLE